MLRKRHETYIRAEMVETRNAKVLIVSIVPLKTHLKERTKNRQDTRTRPVMISTTRNPTDRLA
jgi:ribosomal protein S15P/S13E